ncbi:tRNA N6-adenosine threonylcarbamoyltransferase, mitochondrial {ECO:0000256/HAMAP-Rule:MF_03179} {ECO:0000256/HAMAP-Rule:MF_03179}; AltName: Full=N6-L-threonylcarbamoyladenine synthase {ECO:0000256/HAMAP-Rule:MF_03179}; AltName: Full=t(6)A37 threonylcarbamoyladenosine biosynthesis protein PIIN_01415 {ECO:0000256/HAMAP-Rule:MF_03179}; AltName: Full=tRNA threonylcarbamoyladenosine biosynthesis protein PIIN_01415 {ECO:0000256/HAMAP-Rule:MF_03179} [Serendipita indica DSM 11827]|nr:tRNA N6-adenosine threonylcarbamoyltransferase, mitochondrial {ECO:0000256/HAMAP-Rule:MF_03179} {ECO:0000256/HAMAP-Rule:MF_03179}; AltName: Full=N6-L-threonylcarbamoyladenine synthase {ECO:0000256/HAMAP-Rule:MF_03179}; AltName: Full=t(6)A37 threonylcarbamoyladenosine biosynthesis protein PIIN_01415 {ECO:0000256/HAMAP-Rule:MF_03179}; AltName: Full=tRNA threonylcarbamoyladenosine biosynthesis protein PIIN_01415 {ECO:0000256/HAMAP-Rule:MF_03179} [Serendipita indica DSM 11827]
MPHAIRKALCEANMKMPNIDGIAFTRGPGMGGCLSVSMNAAKALAAAHEKPIIGVHHMQGHALTPQLTNGDEMDGYPFLTLLISGGHTMIALVRSATVFKIMASTVDIAIGNAFDKAARLLGVVPDPGKGYGHALEAFCRTGDEAGEPAHLPTAGRPTFAPLSYSIPNPHQPSQFSYAGLTSAVQRALRDDTVDKQGIARAFQNAAFAQLIHKLNNAIQECQRDGVSIQAVVVSGGVASNLTLRQRLRETAFVGVNGKPPPRFIFPPPELCTDNAAMIAWASMHRFLQHDFDDYSIQPLATWDLESIGAQNEGALSTT